MAWLRPHILAALVVVCVASLFVAHATPSDHPITVITNANLFAPHPSGLVDLYVAGGSLVAVLPHGVADPHLFASMLNAQGGSPLVSLVDVQGDYVLPGLIDPHMHVTGGGGEMGPASRTPSAQVSQIVDGGITTLVGLLGTDGVSRSLENLLQMVLGLEQSGLTTYMLTGSYHTPVKTLFDTVERDVTLIEKVIGVGEVAISDHRSSWPSFQELVQIVSDARVGGMLSGTCGVALFHVGDGPTTLDPLWEIVEKTTIPISQMYPTHVSGRGMPLLLDGIDWIAQGGTVDFTADAPGENVTVEALLFYREQGVDMSHVTVSSDAYGSFPVYKNGVLQSYGVGMPENILNDLRTLVLDHQWSLDSAFSLATNNTATMLQLERKGTLEVGKDADLMVLSASSLDLRYVMAGGAWLKTPDWTASGMFPCT